MADFEEFMKALVQGVKEYATQNWKEHLEAVIGDGGALVNKLKDNLRRWTILLAEGRISKDEFEWLVRAQKDLIEMEALRQIGLTKVRIDRCRNGIIDLVINTAFRFFT